MRIGLPREIGRSFGECGGHSAANTAVGPDRSYVDTYSFHIEVIGPRSTPRLVGRLRLRTIANRIYLISSNLIFIRYPGTFLMQGGGGGF